MGYWIINPWGQMGSPYLLAHGLGVPVENASTVIQVRKAREISCMG